MDSLQGCIALGIAAGSVLRFIVPIEALQRAYDANLEDLDERRESSLFSLLTKLENNENATAFLNIPF